MTGFARASIVLRLLFDPWDRADSISSGSWPDRQNQTQSELRRYGGDARPLILRLDGQDLGPVHAGGFQLAGAQVKAKGRLAHAVQVRPQPLIDFLVLEPLPGLAARGLVS